MGDLWKMFFITFHQSEGERVHLAMVLPQPPAERCGILGELSPIKHIENNKIFVGFFCFEKKKQALSLLKDW